MHVHHDPCHISPLLRASADFLLYNAGANSYGQLGAGSLQDIGDDSEETGEMLRPVSLGARRVVDVAAGRDHTCVILDHFPGDVKCFGRNSAGQLGLGDTRDRGGSPGDLGENLPVVNLGSGCTARQVVLGVRHTCARLNTGQVKCWGSSYYGQVPRTPYECVWVQVILFTEPESCFLCLSLFVSICLSLSVSVCLSVFLSFSVFLSLSLSFSLLFSQNLRLFSHGD